MPVVRARGPVLGRWGSHRFRASQVLNKRVLQGGGASQGKRVPVTVGAGVEGCPHQTRPNKDSVRGTRFMEDGGVMLSASGGGEGIGKATVSQVLWGRQSTPCGSPALISSPPGSPCAPASAPALRLAASGPAHLAGEGGPWRRQPLQHQQVQGCSLPSRGHGRDLSLGAGPGAPGALAGLGWARGCQDRGWMEAGCVTLSPPSTPQHTHAPIHTSRAWQTQHHTQNSGLGDGSLRSSASARSPIPGPHLPVHIHSIWGPPRAGLCRALPPAA